MAVQLHIKGDFNYEDAAHAATDIVGSESPSRYIPLPQLIHPTITL